MTRSDLFPSVLQASHLPAMQAHLLRLCDTDRVQRFAQPASDEVILAYLRRLNFQRDAHYGVWENAGLLPQLVGLTHLAVDPTLGLAEIGVSVDAGYRRQGLAGQMLERAILHARNLGIVEVVMYFLPYNTELMELARRLGMRLSVGHGDGIARLQPGEANLDSLSREWLADWQDNTQRSLHNWAGEVRSASRSLSQLLQNGVEKND